jgi:hypothetical protein
MQCSKTCERRTPFGQVESVLIPKLSSFQGELALDNTFYEEWYPYKLFHQECCPYFNGLHLTGLAVQ